MTETFKVRVSCPHCEMPISFIYYNYGGFSRKQIVNILNAVKYKEDYSISVVEIPDPKKYIHLYRIEDSTTLLHFIKNLRLSRTVLKETITTKKELIDSMVATSYTPPFYCETVEYHGTNYTFIDKVIGGDDVTRRQIANLLYASGYSVGTSKYGDPFVRNARIVIEREDHPLFKKGVWRIYEIKEVRGYVYETKIDE